MTSSQTRNQKQYLGVAKAMWASVKQKYNPRSVLRPDGHALVQTYSIKAAHPELPYAMHFLTMMSALNNGATTKWFANKASTLFMAFLNVNYAQVRKSSITANADEFGDLLDKFVRKGIQDSFDKLSEDEKDAASRRGEAPPARPKPKVTSSVMHSATPEESWYRCSGDYPQVSNGEKVGFDELLGRLNFGVLFNPDEPMIGCCPSASSPMRSQAANAVL